MKIKYLGTAAYEGVPALFCNCEVCKKSRAAGGRNLRTRSQALVDDKIMIDFNPDTVTHTMTYGIDWEKIEGVIITHAHSDHLYPSDAEIATGCYSHDHRKINFYSGKAGYDMLKPYTIDCDAEKTSLTLVEPLKKFTVGGYEILPLPADHGQDTSPVIYSIAKDGKRMLYAHDTGVFLPQTMDALEKEGHHDFISFDCTGCIGDGVRWVYGHMSVLTIIPLLDEMKKRGIADDKTVIAISHFSHNGGLTHDELAVEAAKYGIITAYDGLELEF